MKNTIKKFTAGLLALVMIAGAVPANTGAFDLFTVTPVVASAENTITDTLTVDNTNNSSSYKNWSYTSSETGVTYAGNTAQGNSAIQMRSNNNNSGIVITSSDKNVTGITVSWNDSTKNSRTLYVYGSDTAYSAASDLYDSSKQGSQLGTISKGTSTFTINGEYKYIGIRSSSGALYLNSVGFQFGSSDVAVTGVTLDKTEAQTIGVGDVISFTATVSPENATNKKVIWGSYDPSKVKLYIDSSCETEVGDEPTDVLTVYAKGIAAGSTTIEVASEEDFTNSYATCDITVNAPAPAFKGNSLTLKDDLGLNFIVDNVTAENAEDYKVVLTGECAEAGQELPLKVKNINGEDHYCVTANVPAKNMTAIIKAELYKTGVNEPIDTLEYSVEDYLKAAHKLALETSDQKLGELTKKTAQYGDVARYYFLGGDNPKNDVADHTADLVSYAPKIHSAAMSLVLRSKLAVRLYIPGLTEGVTTDDGKLTAIKGADGEYCFEIKDITPTELGDQYTLTYKGETYEFSPLSWCYRVLNNPDLAGTKHVTMANAVYEYYAAAKDYVTPPAPTATTK